MIEQAGASKIFQLKGGLLDRPRTLVIAPDRMSYETRNLRDESFESIAKQDVCDVIFHSEPIELYHVRLGHRFQISVRSSAATTLNIRCYNYFGLNRRYGDDYTEISGLIWKYYLADVLQRHLDYLSNGGRLDLLGVGVTFDGITFKQQTYHWKAVSLFEYYDYFAVSVKETPHVYFSQTFRAWGAEMLFAIVRSLAVN